jgi:PPOX class probable F420-dependent enzyme
MPTGAATLPAELIDLLTTNVVGHVTLAMPSGRLITHVMWIDAEDGRVLTSSRLGSAKGGAWRADPRAAISVVDPKDPWRWLSISGRVVEIRPDTDLAFIDALSRRYMGRDYPMRDMAREIFVIEPDRIRSSSVRR